MDFKWNGKTKQIEVRTISKRGSNITNIKAKWTKWNNLFKTDGSISPSVSRLTVFRDALQREAAAARQQIDENDKQIKLEEKKLEEIAERQQFYEGYKQYKLEEAKLLEEKKLEDIAERQQFYKDNEQYKLEEKKSEETKLEDIKTLDEEQDEIRNVIDELTVVSMECKEIINDPDKILTQRLAKLSGFNKTNLEQYVKIEKDFEAGINLEDQIQKNEDASCRGSGRKK